MNITCNSCGVAFDAPGTGDAACPACHHLNPRPRASGPREISLSSLGDDEPAPPTKTPSFTATTAEQLLAQDVDFGNLSNAAPVAVEEPDLPAPKKPNAPSRSVAAPDPDVVDLPAPRVKKPTPPAPGVVDLPAPRGAKPSVPAASAPGVVDLPAPKKPPLPSAAKAPPPLPGKPSPPPVPGRTLDAPRAPAPPALELEAPLSEAPLELDSPDLDAPDVDDAPLAGADVVDLPAPRFGEGSEIDLPAPRADGNVDLPAPRADGSVDLLAPVLEDSSGLPAPKGPAEITDGPSDAVRAHLRAIKERAQQPAYVPPEPPPAPPKSRRLVFIGGGVVAALAIGGAVALKLDLFGGKAAQQALAAQLDTARKAIASDTIAGFRREVQALRPLTSSPKPSEDAALLEAQLHLLEAHLGAGGELDQAKSLLEVPPGKIPSPERPHAEALRALDEGDLAAARTTLKGVTSANPNDAVAFTYLGWVEIEARDPKSAAAAFSRAIAIEPKRAAALYGLALANERLGDDHAAGDGYDKALAQSPEHLRAKMGRFRVHARQGDADAAHQLDAMLAQQSASFGKGEIAEAQESLGEIAAGAGRVDEAEERFKKAIALDPEFGKSHVAWDAKVGLARLRVATGHSAQAIDDLRKLVAIDKKAVEPRLLLAQALVEKRETEEAQTLVGAVDQLAPKDARLALLRGELLEARESVSADDREQAIAKYKDAVAADPKLIEGWTALAKALYAQGKTQDALDALAKAAAVLSGNAHGAALVGQTYLAIGQPAEAEARFRAVLGSGKPSTDVLPLWLGLGESLEAQDKLDEAKKAYADARQVAPGDALFVEKQARIAVRQGQLDEAKRLFDEALKLGTPTAALRIAASDVALSQKRYDDARALVEPVVKDDDRNPRANLAMARIELESGHPEDAVGYARRAVTIADLPEAHLVLAQVDEMTNKLDAAAGEYNLARRPPTADRATLGRARVFVLMKSTKDALVEVTPLLKGPYKPEALLIVGDCYSDLQQLDKARKAYDEAARLSPQSAEAQFKHGRAELDAGKRGPGVEALERAAKLAGPKTPWLPDAWFNIADGHRQAHQRDAAAKAYKKYLSIAPADAPMRQEAEKQLSLLGDAGGPTE